MPATQFSKDALVILKSYVDAYRQAISQSEKERLILKVAKKTSHAEGGDTADHEKVKWAVLSNPFR